MSSLSLSENLAPWEALGAHVSARLAELPHLEATLRDFNALILEGKELQSTQDVYRRQLREATVRSRDLARRGRSLRNRLIAGVQAAFGVENAVLVEFGVNPRISKKRSRLTKAQREKLAAAEEILAAAAAGSPAVPQK